jgi:hypothetical protein
MAKSARNGGLALIYNVINGTFNKYGIRSGDLIAMINFLQWFRKDQNRPNIKLHIGSNVLVLQDYVREFFDFLCENTDCFSQEPGYTELPYYDLMLWDFRDIIGDHVVINNIKEIKPKVVVFPIYDATYHTTRNWSIKLFQNILEEFSKKYPNHEKIICVKDTPEIAFNNFGFSVSTNFMNNINHIMEAEVFIGGDTGTTHFASALNRGPKELIYYYNGRGMIHTLPFHLSSGKGTLRRYWVNCENTTYNGKSLI